MPTVVLMEATRGIGRAAAIEIARRGAELAIVGRDAARVEATATEARAVGGDSTVREHVADLARMDEVRRLAAELLDAYPRIDVLVNDAGAMFTSRHVTPDGFEHLRAEPSRAVPADEPAARPAHRLQRTRGDDRERRSQGRRGRPRRPPVRARPLPARARLEKGPIAPSVQAQDDRLATELWERSERLTSPGPA